MLSKIRGRISPQLQYMNSGGAATSLPVLQFFEDIGVPITEVGHDPPRGPLSTPFLASI